MVTIGRLDHWLLLEEEMSISDGKGGYTQEWVALDPANAWGSIHGTGGQNGERRVAGTTVAQGTHTIGMRYHPSVTTKTRASWTDRHGRLRTVSIVSVTDVDEDGEWLELVAVEVTPS